MNNKAQIKENTWFQKGARAAEIVFVDAKAQAGALKVKKRFVGFQGVDRVKAAEIRRQLGIGDIDGKVGSPIAPYGWWTKSVTHN